MTTPFMPAVLLRLTLDVSVEGIERATKSSATRPGAVLSEPAERRAADVVYQNTSDPGAL